MSQLLESILLLNGKFRNLDFHENRIQRSRKELFRTIESLDLRFIEELERKYPIGKFKARIIYGKEVDSIEVKEYIPKSINSLKLVHSTVFDYHLKFADRSILDLLVSKKEDADDIIIVIDDRITDASYANLAFFDGNMWWTPSHPLLAGTKRHSLLKQKKIKERNIRVADLKQFEKLSLINAMLDLDEIHLSISQII